MKNENNELIPFSPPKIHCPAGTSHIFPGHPYWDTLVAASDLIPSTPELNRLKEFLATVACGRALSPEMREFENVLHADRALSV